ncbi:hypothetical protein AAC387_Pa09g1652 [Persea americana]
MDNIFLMRNEYLNSDLQPHNQRLQEDSNLQPQNKQQPENSNLQPENNQQPENSNLQPKNKQQPENSNLQPREQQQPVNSILQPQHQQQPEDSILQPHKRRQPLIKEENKVRPASSKTPRIGSDPCLGRYIYVHNLPRRFNEDILKNCRSLSLWTDMCKVLSNRGFGPKIKNGEGAFSRTGWFATNQFALEVIFYHRMKQYECLTTNSSLASAIYVPFFAGLDVSRYLWGGFNTSVRDFHSLELVKWLENKPEWRAFGGRDHFLVGGRITWDFRRPRDTDSEWGNKLLVLPQVKNMTVLVIESSPWSSYDIGVPYPTYFHPSKDREVSQWQRRMRGQKRSWLFSFAGAPRPGSSDSIRGEIINQCLASKRSKLLECSQRGNKCHSPSSIMMMFQRSVFCLQPQGDSYTRRSIFDSILAGCIPVFFHPGSAYIQYTWYFPLNHTSYSVFISENDVRDGKVNIETALLKIPKAQVKAMRQKVIELIPRIIYADPRSRLETTEDAFDIAVKGVLERVSRLKKDIREGRKDMDFEEDNSWKMF